MPNRIRPLAIYLPQFHPTPENNEWWGNGFTEWTNVTKAKPLFKGHYQPRLPRDFGFYDLRCVETHVAQAEMARNYGIEGFAYYHYWFNEKRLLHQPIDLVLKHKEINFPFCLFWANETWSRRWLGEEKEILIEQKYSFDDDRNHIKWLIEAFKDPRYIKVGDRPVFIFYRPTHMPDVTKTLSIFKEECVKEGVACPYFIASNSHAGSIDLHKLGFDGILDFQPQLGRLPYAFDDSKSLKKIKNNLSVNVLSRTLKVYDYERAKQLMCNKKEYKSFPCAFVGWDNTARRGKNGIILRNGSPEIFARYLEMDIEYLQKMNYSPDENFLFINAWNEWAEGNHLEPDRKHGKSYLEAFKKVISGKD